VPTGKTFGQVWAEADVIERRKLMKDAGFAILAAKDRENGLTAWFRIDADLAQRAAAAAEGHAADVPVPEDEYLMQHWKLGVVRDDGSFYWSHRVFITGDPAERYGPGHDPSDEELARWYEDCRTRT